MTMAVDAALREDPLHRLTPKEQACLRLVAGHLSSKEIASRLGISKTSVDTYCDRAREKLGVRGRHEAARMLAAALADRPPAPPRPAVAAAVAAAPAARRPRRRLLLAVLAVVLAPLALATLLAGLRALREVVPDPHEQPSAQAAQPASG